MKKLKRSLYMKYVILFSSILFASLFLSALAANYLSVLPKVEVASRQMVIAFTIRVFIYILPIGLIFIGIAVKFVLKPIKALSESAQRVARGDYQVEVEYNENRQDEIGVLIDRFNYMVKEIGKNEYLHKDFVSNVSHEFKTPIASIQGYLELLALPNLSEEKRLEYIEVASRQVNQLSKLSTSLLKLSELEHQQSILHEQTFSLTEQMREVLIYLQLLWEEKQIEIKLEIEEISIEANKDLLFQVWVNLIENAIKYTPNLGQISISMYEKDGFFISITDTGIGMKEEDLGRAFEKFYKADRARKDKSNGLGLSIVKRIVELHGGTIGLESTWQEGTMVTVHLPRAVKEDK